MYRFALLALVALAGCASARAAYWSGGERWGCNAEGLQLASAEVHRGVRGIFPFTPQVGWSACELFAHSGLPASVTTVSTSGGGREMQHLNYRGNSSHRGGLVVLERAPRGWIVESVVWER